MYGRTKLFSPFRIHFSVNHDLENSFLKHIYLFGQAGSLLLHALSSSCGEWGLLSSWGARASHCSGFSHRGAQALGCSGSVPAAQGLSILAPGLQSSGSAGVLHRLSCSKSCGLFPDQGLNLCLPRWPADALPSSHQGNH